MLSGVKTLTVTDAVFMDLDSASSLETATLDFTNDYDPDLTSAQVTASAKANSSTYVETLGATGDIGAASLTNLTVTGHLLDLYLDEANLETLTLDVKMDDLTLDSMTDLTTVSIAETTAMNDVVVTGNTNLTSLNIAAANNFAANGTTAQTSTTLTVTGNTSLTSLTSVRDDIGALTVTGNTSLATIDFTGLKDFGGATEPSVYIHGNDLDAVTASDAKDGDTAATDGTSKDLGSYNSGTSGMKTLKAYLGVVAAEGDSDAYVSFDSVATFVNSESGSDVTTLNVNFVSTTTQNAATILYDVEKVSSGGGSATKAKRSYLIDIDAVNNAQFTANGQDLLDINGDGVPAAYVFVGQTQASIIAALNDADNKALATANGVTMNAAAGGNSTLAIHVGSQLNSALWETSAAVTTNLHLTASDVINLTVGNQTVTLTAATSNASYEVYSVTKSVGAAIATRWAAVNTGASKPIFNFTESVAQASSSIDGDTGHMLTFTAKDKGTGGAGLSASLTISALDSTGNNGTLPVSYGATSLTTDNTSTGPDVVLTFESNTAGVIGNVIGNPATSATSGTFSAATLSHAAQSIAGITELHSNLLANAGTNKVTSTDGHYDENRSDVVYPEVDVDATVTSAAVDYSHVHWLD